MDYYVIRQAMGAVTIAARLLPAQFSETRKDVENLARNIVVTRKITADEKR
jgi:hypothetical protein